MGPKMMEFVEFSMKLLSKNVVPMPILKEFFLKCLEQFTIYIWTFVLLAKMNAYLKK